MEPRRKKNTEEDERTPEGSTSEKEKNPPSSVVLPCRRLEPRYRRYILYGRLVMLHELVISAINKRWTGFKCAYSRGRGWTVAMDEAILYERLFRQVRQIGMDNLLLVIEEGSTNELPAVETSEKTAEEDGAKQCVDHQEHSDDDQKVTSSAPIVPIRPMRQPKPLRNPWVFTVNGQRTTDAEVAICGLIYNWELIKPAALKFWGQRVPRKRTQFHLNELPMLQATLDAIRQDSRYANVDTPSQLCPLEDTLRQFHLPPAKLFTTVKKELNSSNDDL